jgi:CRP-like cAMP-binding protein/rhodanese-related sulfurtransferase
MSVFGKHDEGKAMQTSLRDLVPLNSLSDKHFEEISANMAVSGINAGDYLFGAGDIDNRAVYLLEGEVSFLDTGGRVTGVVSAGSEPARYPLANRQPRLVSARATCRCLIATIDPTLLDVLLTLDQSAEPRASDIRIDSGEDWMTRVLQSEAFIKIPPPDIQRLLSRLESVPVSAGEVIIRQGDEGDYFYILREGTCSVTRHNNRGGWDVPLAELGSGDCFGEEALVSESTRNATITMLTNGSVMRLSKDNFLELLKKPLVHYIDYDQACAMVLEGGTWLDVRLQDEYANYALKGSLNIPLADIRDRARELEPDRNYIICCDTGRRSAAAAFLLSQRGFEVQVLEGGMRYDIPLADLGIEEEGEPLPAYTTARPRLVVTGDSGRKPERDSDGQPDAEGTDRLREAFARVQRDMSKFRETSRRLEAAVEETREARKALEAELRALAALTGQPPPK